MGTGIGLIFYWENGIGTTGTGICDTKFTAGNGIQVNLWPAKLGHAQILVGLEVILGWEMGFSTPLHDPLVIICIRLELKC